MTPLFRSRFIALCATLAVTLGAVGCSSTNSSDDGTLHVSASFYPIAWLSEQIGGDRVTVTSVTPTNVEPHDYELSPADVTALSKADLIVYVAGFQPSMDDAVDQLTGPSVAELSSVADLQKASSAAVEADGSTSESNLDPHFWLDPVRMQAVAAEIERSLAEQDPDNAATYEKNLGALQQRLTALDSAYETGLATCERDTIVTSHAAFSYMANRYGLTQVSISGIDPESEPSPADLAAVKKAVEETGTTTIFTESLVSPKTANALAAETGTETAVLDPMESQPQEDDYLAAMESNLSALRTALSCQ
ncbi:MULTISPECIES: metal ABC transporter substrate-binding protein [unclassified Actinobaculum]|uniref:metal ABC transporter substrate-binding protein n=1 Tax=unclassified Actinobaculum TaxID=2609299 RepID=UPI001F0B7527|nr:MULTISPECIES: metal ABC transporter substrate-binding protein [unclassified Actinobaculum]